MGKNYTQNLDKVIKIDEAEIKDHLGEMVRGLDIGSTSVHTRK